MTIKESRQGTAAMGDIIISQIFNLRVVELFAKLCVRACMTQGNAEKPRIAGVLEAV